VKMGRTGEEETNDASRDLVCAQVTIRLTGSGRGTE
jgi:hypothetical protein